MKLITGILSTVMVTIGACTGEVSVNHKEETNLLSIDRFKCTETQMKLVESETMFCKNNTGYLSTYCYQAAMHRHCAIKDITTEKEEH